MRGGGRRVVYQSDVLPVKLSLTKLIFTLSGAKCTRKYWLTLSKKSAGWRGESWPSYLGILLGSSETPEAWEIVLKPFELWLSRDRLCWIRGIVKKETGGRVFGWVPWGSDMEDSILRGTDGGGELLFNWDGWGRGGEKRFVFCILFSTAASREACPSRPQRRSVRCCIWVVMLRCTLLIWLILSLNVEAWEVLLRSCSSMMLFCTRRKSLWKFVWTLYTLEVISVSISSTRVQSSKNLSPYSVNRREELDNYRRKRV